MYYLRATESIYTSDGAFVKKLECPIRMSSDSLLKISGSDDRTCGNCNRRVISLDGMSDSSVVSVVESTPNSCHFLSRVEALDCETRSSLQFQPPKVMQPSQSHKPDTFDAHHEHGGEDYGEAEVHFRYPRIRTVRDLSQIDELSMAGARLIIKPVILSPEIKQKAEVWRNRRTGSLLLNNDYRRDMRGEGKDWELVIPWFFYRPSPPQGAIAAYMIPLGLMPGDRVYIEDLIEDIPTNVNEAQQDADRLKSAFATWTGTDFTLEAPVTLSAVG